MNRNSRDIGSFSGHLNVKLPPIGPCTQSRKGRVVARISLIAMNEDSHKPALNIKTRPH